MAQGLNQKLCVGKKQQNTKDGLEVVVLTLFTRWETKPPLAAFAPLIAETRVQIFGHELPAQLIINIVKKEVHGQIKRDGLVNVRMKWSLSSCAPRKRQTACQKWCISPGFELEAGGMKFIPDRF